MGVLTERTRVIHELGKRGQGLWLDNLRRQLITSGELAQLCDEGVTGVTSKPTIFEKAVSGSTEHDEALARLVRTGRKPEQILWEVMIEDIQSAADIFGPATTRPRAQTGLSRSRSRRRSCRTPSERSRWPSTSTAVVVGRT
jgi:transaldolase